MGLGLHNVAFNSATHAITNGLVGWWKFDEGNGTITADSSGFKHTGSFLNSPTWVSGKTGNGLSFTGTNSSNAAGVVTQPLTISSSAVTLMGWININWNASLGGSFPLILEAGESATTGLALTIATGTFQDWINGDILCFGNGYTGTTNFAPRAVAAQPTLTAFTWHHVAGVLSPNLSQIYVDGVPLTMRVALTGSVGNITTAINFASYPSGTGDWSNNSKLDDIRIYNRALSPNEIKQIANILG